MSVLVAYASKHGSTAEIAEQQPGEMAAFQESIGPRDHRVFFGALDHHKLSFPERMVVKAGERGNWGSRRAGETGNYPLLKSCEVCYNTSHEGP